MEIYKIEKSITKEDVKAGMRFKRLSDDVVYNLTNITKIDDLDSTKIDFFYHFGGFVIKGKKLLSKMFEKNDQNKLNVYSYNEV